MFFKVYDKVWIMMSNKPTKMIIFAVIDSMNYYKDSTERTYRLVNSQVGAGWGNNEGIIVNERKIFYLKEELLKSL